MRKLIAVLLGAGLLLGTTAGSCGSPEPMPEIEVEDCDAEDFRNREAECGFTDADRRTPAVKPPTAKPPVQQPARQPATRSTKR